VWYASDAAYAEVLAMRKAAGLPLHPKSNLAARRRAAAAAAPAAAAADRAEAPAPRWPQNNFAALRMHQPTHVVPMAQVS
jgi:hypothetical protein